MMDLFGKEAKKRSDEVLAKVKAELTAMGIPDDQVSSFMSKVTEGKKEAAAKPDADEAGQGDKAQKEKKEEGEGEPERQTQASTVQKGVNKEGANPDGEAGKGEPSGNKPEQQQQETTQQAAQTVDYGAELAETKKTLGEVSASLRELRDVVVKLGGLKEDKGFGNETPVPSGNDESDSQETLKNLNTPRR